MPAPPAPPLPASLSHFVLFSPTLRSPPPAPGSEVDNPDHPNDADPEERNHDLEADLREAAQILFYTSRQAGGVSRDKMLRQVGLAKGLMGFADMLAPGELDQPKFWSIHSHRTRMIVYSPEPDFFIYLNVTLAHAAPVAGASASRGEPSNTAQGLSDRMLVDALARGYADFRLLHGPLAELMPPSPSLSSLLEKYWTRFAFSLEAAYLLSPPSAGLLQTWLGGYAPSSPELSGAASRALETFVEDCDLEEHIVGIINAQGPLAVRGPGAMDEAGMRYLHHLLEASLPPPVPVEPQGKSDGRSGLGFGIRRKKERDESRKTSWASFGIGNAVSWVPGIGSRPVTPMPADEGKASKPQPGASVGGKVAERVSSASSSTTTTATATATRWPSLGLTGLSEAMGNMGTALGLGTKPADGSRADTPTRGEAGTAAHEGVTEEQREPADAKIEDSSSGEPPGGADVSSTLDTHESPQVLVSPPTEQERESSPEPSSEAKEHHQDPLASHSHDVLQTSVVLPDLEAAVQTEPEVEIGWESRLVHVVDGEATTRRSLQWVIRDNILLFILHPAEPADPTDPSVSARSTLSLFSKLSALLAPEQQPNSEVSAPPTSSPHFPLSNSVIFHPSASSTRISGPPVDAATGATMMELKDTIESYPNTSEIFARTPAGRFVLVKRTRTLSVPAQEPIHSDTDEPPQERGEVYMLVGRKDASLTDAEHAMRGLARAHPELVA